MATILESPAAFEARALEHGITTEQLGQTQGEGLDQSVQISLLHFRHQEPVRKIEIPEIVGPR